MHRLSYVSIQLVGLSNMIGVGFLLPAIPSIARSFQVSEIESTMMVAAFPLFQLFGSLALGRLSDKRNIRLLLSSSLLLSAVCYFLYQQTSSFYILLLLRSICGFCAGSIAVSQGWITKNTKVNERAKFLGIFNAISSVGFIFGLLFSTVVGVNNEGNLNYGLAATVTGTIFIVAAACCLIIAETKGKEESTNNLTEKVLLHNFEKKQLRSLYFLHGTNSLVYVVLMTSLPFFLEREFGSTPVISAYYFVLSGITISACQGIIIKYIRKEKTKSLTPVFMALLSATVYCLIPSSIGNHLALIVLVLLASISFSLSSPLLQSSCSEIYPKEHQGHLMGNLGVIACAGAVIGPLMSGALLKYNSELPFYLASSFSFLVFLFIMALNHSKEEDKDNIVALDR